jgi:hypothetical protein
MVRLRCNYAYGSLRPLGAVLGTGRTKKNTPPVGEVFFLVELVENCLHPLTLELERWHSIIGEHYLDYKLEEQRNSLACNPKGIPL